jgi:hypothetical protein
MNPYRYCGNAPTDATDPSGSIKLSLVYHPGRLGKFGGFSSMVDWVVAPAAPPVKGAPSNANVYQAIENHASGDWPVGTWVVQTLHVSFDVHDEDGDAFDDPRDDGHWNYSEAWWIPPGRGGQGMKGRHFADTYWLPSGTSCAYGTIVFTGSLQLYTNITLPAAFTRENPDTNAHTLPSTTSTDAMANFNAALTAPVAHVVTVSWTLGGATTVSTRN